MRLLLLALLVLTTASFVSFGGSTPSPTGVARAEDPVPPQEPDPCEDIDCEAELAEMSCEDLYEFVADMEGIVEAFEWDLANARAAEEAAGEAVDDALAAYNACVAGGGDCDTLWNAYQQALRDYSAAARAAAAAFTTWWDAKQELDHAQDVIDCCCND